ncbi:MAG: aminotransferase class III-fold pyridoxal phosphate-dependent enzyme [Vicinamibacteria bacterium]
MMDLETEAITRPMGGDEMVEMCKRYTMYEWSAQSKIDPIPVARAEGVYFYSPDGKKYLDFNSQLMCSNIGHSHPRVVAAIQKQAASLTYANPFMATAPRARLGKKLAEITPGDIESFFFTNGGAEANENAIRIARIVTGRHKVMVRYRSYHGGTAGALAMTGDPRRWYSEPGIPGIVRAPDFHKYGRKEAEALDVCIRELEDVIRYEGGQNIAAFLIETVVGTNGILIPPDGYMKAVREICDRHGILLIVDEVMSGFGRTGKWFAVNHWDVVPDMICMAKGLTSAYVQLGAVGMRPHIAKTFQDRAFPGGLTYNSHPLACATALATIAVYEDEGLIDQAAKLGVVLRERMQEIAKKHPSVGVARSIGLFGIVELVRNRATWEPMAPYNGHSEEMMALGAFFRKEGLYTMVRWNTFFTNPPLVITEAQLLEGLSIIDRGLEITDRAVK